jgi:hypothetical protein
MPAGNRFLVSATLNDTIYVIKKSSIFDADWHGLTQKIKTLVSVAYVSQHKKSIFKNKKLPSPDLGL